MIAKSFTERQFLRRYIWLSILALITAFCAFQTSEAQINSDCVTTAIWVEGYGWVADSEQTTCTGTNTPDNDGFIGDGGDSPCGPGGCPEAPEDTDEGLSDEQKCQIEQAAESERDRVAREISDIIKSKKDRNKKEFGAGIFRTPDGLIKRTEIFTGPANGGSVVITFRMPAGSEIIGDVHSHPRENLASNNSAPSTGDWKDVDENFFGNPSHAVEENFAMYILSPTGKFAEFDYNGGRPKKSSATHQRDARSECE